MYAILNELLSINLSLTYIIEAQLITLIFIQLTKLIYIDIIFENFFIL
jgi:hypothetical protein